MQGTHDRLTSRPPAVAGSFYPADPDVLTATVGRMLHDARLPPLHVDIRMLISPHAGHQYSGPVAATGFASLSDAAFQRPIGLIGPSHFIPVPGMSLPEANVFDTPLGRVVVDDRLRTIVSSVPGVGTHDPSHAREHSLEVQLPFLQVRNPDVTVVPLVTGDDFDAAASVIDALLDEGSLVVVSSDLSHYLDHQGARRQDARTAGAIVELEPERLAWPDACGLIGIQGALTVARRRGWECQLLDLRNSGDTAGGTHRVVGYGSFAIGPPT